MEPDKQVCGIVMPISSIDGCSDTHWTEVLAILSDSVADAGFEPNLVSNADDVGLIHKRIIQNLYENPIVVCDVSGKNANVMFELGMRLAFDKPTIIVKDDITTYSFDTAPIEHIEYPRDLRFSQIVEFKRKLADKLVATVEKSQNNSSYTTFLKHFGEFKIAKLEQKEVSGEEYIIDEIRSLKLSMFKMEALMRHMDSGDRRANRFAIAPNESAMVFSPAIREMFPKRTLEEDIYDDIKHGWKDANIVAHYLAQGHAEEKIQGIIDLLKRSNISK